MNEIVANSMAILIPALIEYILWLAIYEYTKIDYGKIITISLVGIISAIPLLFIIFHLSFNSIYYQQYLDFTNKYMIQCIVGTVLGHIFTRNSCH